jgi:hypothetical protein
VNTSAPQTCFGFSIRSAIDLRFTRPGVSADQIEVVEMRGAEPQHDEPPLLNWTTSAGVTGRLYGGGQIFDFWAEGDVLAGTGSPRSTARSRCLWHHCGGDPGSAVHGRSAPGRPLAAAPPSSETAEP